MVERAIAEAIAKGRFQPGSRLPSEAALSQELGIARMTLRHALARLVEQGLLEPRRGVGTFVRATRASGRNVGLLIFHSVLGAQSRLGWNLVETLRREAKARGFGARVTVLVEPLPPPAQLASELRAAGVAAVGLGGFLDTDREFIHGLAQLLPCVLFNKSLAGVALPCAQPDLGEATRLMVDFFVRRGRQRVGLAIPSVEHSLYHDLSVILAAELHRCGLMVDKALWFQGDDPSSEGASLEWLEQVPAQPRRPDALIVFGDQAPRRLQAALERRGERLGEAMDVIACHNTFDAREVRAPWPVLVWNLADAAQAAARMLLDLGEGREDFQGAPVFMARPFLVLPQEWNTGADKRFQEPFSESPPGHLDKSGKEVERDSHLAVAGRE